MTKLTRNVIERVFEEIRRRTLATDAFFGVSSDAAAMLETISLYDTRHVVFMVIPSMRFIDNRRTIPQVLKASSVNPFFEPLVSRGMHPIIGTLSVLPGGDNDARSFPPLLPRHSGACFSVYLATLPTALGSQSLAKNLIYPLCAGR